MKMNITLEWCNGIAVILIDTFLPLNLKMIDPLKQSVISLYLLS